MTFIQTQADPAPVGSPPSGRARPDPRVALWLLGAQLTGGILVGLSWLAWSPTTIAFVLAGEGGRTFLIPDESESQIAGDGRFVVLSACVGLVVAVLTWRIRRARGPVALVLLGAGGVLGSLLARTVGSALASGHTTGAVSTVIHPPLSLHSVPMIWVQALVAIFSYMALAGLSSDPDLGAPPLTGTQSGPEGSGTGWDGAQAAQQR